MRREKERDYTFERTKKRGLKYEISSSQSTPQRPSKTKQITRRKREVAQNREKRGILSLCLPKNKY